MVMSRSWDGKFAIRLPICACQSSPSHELWSGWWTAIQQAKDATLAATGYERLTETITELRNWHIVAFAEPAMHRYKGLKGQKLNVRANDLKIAAIALELSATVVTRNTRDFSRVGGLTIEDWST